MFIRLALLDLGFEKRVVENEAEGDQCLLELFEEKIEKKKCYDQ